MPSSELARPSIGGSPSVYTLRKKILIQGSFPLLSNPRSPPPNSTLRLYFNTWATIYISNLVWPLPIGSSCRGPSLKLVKLVKVCFYVTRHFVKFSNDQQTSFFKNTFWSAQPKSIWIHLPNREPALIGHFRPKNRLLKIRARSHKRSPVGSL